MNIFLEERKKDITAFKKAINLCKENKSTVKVLEKYLHRIEEEFRHADILENQFIPLIKNKENFHSAFIFHLEDISYRIEVFIHNLDENSKKEYVDIYNDFRTQNEELLFDFNVYDITKDKEIYNEAKDYDKITIKVKK